MPARVLIVDDHASFRSLARRLLVAGGFEVVGEATGGAEAITAARELTPDVVLLDVQLPDVDGFQVAKTLSADGSGAAIVLVSSRVRAEYGRRVEFSGARGFITKADLSGDTLQQALRGAPT